MTDPYNITKRVQHLKAKRKLKGNAAWKPASVLNVPIKEPGYTYRFRLKDPENIQRVLVEGWEFVTKPSGHEAPAVDTLANMVDDTGRLKTSLTEFRELILMRLPDELKQERDEYYELVTETQHVTPEKFRDHTSEVLAQMGIDDKSLYNVIE